MAKILSLSNHKGGCGKTTSTINIAAGLAKNGRRVLVVDIDPQANATQGMGLNPYEDHRNIYGALTGQYELTPIAVSDGLDIVPSTLNLVAAEMQLVNEYGRERILLSLLEPMADKYDYILLDCPPSLGILTLNAMTAADAILLPIQPQFFAVQGLQQLLNIVVKVRKGLNPHLHIGGVFITDFDSRTKMHADAAATIRQAFPDEMFATTIRHNIALAESSARGMSVFDYNPKSNGAADYSALVQEVEQRFGR